MVVIFRVALTNEFVKAARKITTIVRRSVFMDSRLRGNDNVTLDASTLKEQKRTEVVA